MSERIPRPSLASPLSVVVVMLLALAGCEEGGTVSEDLLPTFVDGALYQTRTVDTREDHFVRQFDVVRSQVRVNGAWVPCEPDCATAVRTHQRRTSGLPPVATPERGDSGGGHAD
jgi:hypothetical protein